MTLNCALEIQEHEEGKEANGACAPDQYFLRGRE